MNKTISIFGWDVEEKVMETLIYKMKTSCTPPVLHERMYIGAGANILEITERNILRMRENSIFFRICWEELQGTSQINMPLKSICEQNSIS